MATSRVSPRRRPSRPSRCAGGTGAHEGPRHAPAAGAELLDADVLDRRVDDLALVGAHLHGALEELGDDEGLVAALLEAAHVDQPGRDDLATLDRGHPGHRHEDPASTRHLDDEADDARSAAGDVEGDDDVADAADLVAERVEDAQLGRVGRRRRGSACSPAQAIGAAPPGAGGPAHRPAALAAHAVRRRGRRGVAPGAGAAAPVPWAPAGGRRRAAGRDRGGARLRRHTSPGDSTGRPWGVSTWMVHDCRHRSATSPTALSRSGPQHLDRGVPVR